MTQPLNSKLTVLAIDIAPGAALFSVDIAEHMVMSNHQLTIAVQGGTPAGTLVILGGAFQGKGLTKIAGTALDAITMTVNGLTELFSGFYSALQIDASAVTGAGTMNFYLYSSDKLTV